MSSRSVVGSTRGGTAAPIADGNRFSESIDSAQLRILTIRRRSGLLWTSLVTFAAATATVMVAWFVLGIANDAAGFVLVAYLRQPPANRAELTVADRVALLEAEASPGVLRRLESEEPLGDRTSDELDALLDQFVFQSTVVQTWSIVDSVFRRDEIEAIAAQVPGAELRMHSWVNPSFLVRPLNRRPLQTGIRTALLGSLWIVALSMAIAFPVGVATAVFLTEYATAGWFTRFVRVNVETMASVPSIIYGILGLALFVRTLGSVTSGAFLGTGDGSAAGRTILSAGLTLAILVLPAIIINVRDILENVPPGYREACYSVGARRSTVVMRRILPSVGGQLVTVLLLGISRVIGETAPLLVIGAAAFITVDPSGIFSRFTSLPTQIFFWTSGLTGANRNLAAAAIVVLIVLSIGLNVVFVLIKRRLENRAAQGVR